MQRTLHSCTTASNLELACPGVLMRNDDDGRQRDTARFITAAGERTVVCTLTPTGAACRSVWRVYADLLCMPSGDIVVTSVRNAKSLHPLALTPDALCPVRGTVRALRSLARLIAEPLLQQFVDDVFADYAVFEDFWAAQCAPSHHWPGGLAVHTTEVVRATADSVDQPQPDGQTWRQQEQDIAICAALVHDMGECRDDGRPLAARFEAQRHGMEMRHLDLIQDAVANLHNHCRPLARALLAVLFPLTRFPDTGLRIGGIRSIVLAADRASVASAIPPAATSASHSVTDRKELP